MKRLRIYLWFAAFIFLANGWLCYVLSSWNVVSSDQAPIWQNLLTWAAVISQLPSLPISRVIADFFGLSYTGWAITTSIISVFIYFPVIHLTEPWGSGLSARSISRKATSFSSSLRPCGLMRKNHPSSAPLNKTNTLSHSEKHA
jgi:hypothetical protein